MYIKLKTVALAPFPSFLSFLWFWGSSGLIITLVWPSFSKTAVIFIDHVFINPAIYHTSPARKRKEREGPGDDVGFIYNCLVKSSWRVKGRWRARSYLARTQSRSTLAEQRPLNTHEHYIEKKLKSPNWVLCNYFTISCRRLSDYGPQTPAVEISRNIFEG